MRAIAFFSLVLLAISIAPAAVTAAAPPATPIYPGMGDAASDLYGRHPYLKGTTVITDYIRECGIGNWYETRMENGLLSVHIPPERSCGKQLVFSTTHAGKRDDPTQIRAVWILDAGGTWSETMDPVYPDGWTYRTRGLMEEAGKIPPVFVAGGVITLVLIGIAFVFIERRKRSS